MNKHATLVLFGILAVAGMGLFGLKYHVQALEEERDRLRVEIAAARDGLHVGKADWAHLARAERIAELARRHLDMAPRPVANLPELSALPWRRDRVAAQNPITALSPVSVGEAGAR